VKINKGVFVSVPLSVILVTGCGSQSGQGNQNSPSGSGGSNLKGQTITFWADQEGPANTENAVWNQVISDFKKQTGITVQYQVVPWSNLWTKIMTAVTSNNGPDVVALGNTWASTLAATGGFVSLTSDKLQQIGGESKFVPSAFAVTGLAGQPPIAVPYLSESMGLFYNKQMFKEAGITNPPTTWSEFVADAQKLTKNGIYGFGMDGADVNDDDHLFYALMNQNGSNYITNGKPTLTNSAAQKSANFIADLITKYNVVAPDSAEWNAQDHDLAFAQGKVAMIIDQTPAMVQIEADGMKSSQFGVAPIPMIPYGETQIPTGGSMVGSHVAGIDLGILKSSTHQDAALAFLKYVTDVKTQVMLNKAFGTIPVNPQAYSDPAFQSADYKTFEDILQKYAKPTPAINNEGTIENDIGAAIKTIISDAVEHQLKSDTITTELNQAQQQVLSQLQ
jgi:multiple sugar transport system substrate-binding protein